MMPVRRSNQTWLPSIFNDFFDNDWMVKANATAPAINVIESDKDYKVEVAAPGMTKEDFKIHINEDNDLVISMEKKTENISKTARFTKAGTGLEINPAYNLFEEDSFSFTSLIVMVLFVILAGYLIIYNIFN